MKKISLKVGDRVQWIKGDNFGKTEVINEITKQIIKFESGRQIFVDVFYEFMQVIDVNSDILIEQADVLYTRKKTLNEAVNKNTKKLSDNVRLILNTFEKSSSKLNEDNSRYIIIKLKRLPASNVVKLMYNIFEENEVDEAFILFLENKMESIISQISKNLKDLGDV